MNRDEPSSEAGSNRNGAVPRIRTASLEVAAAEVAAAEVAAEEVAAASNPHKKNGRKRMMRSFMSRRLLLTTSPPSPRLTKKCEPVVAEQTRCLQNFTNLSGTIEEFSVTGALCGASGKEMQQKPFLQLTLAGSLCAVALFAADFWKTKDYTQWSSEEVTKVLTDSPWAKEISVSSGQQQQRRSGG